MIFDFSDERDATSSTLRYGNGRKNKGRPTYMNRTESKHVYFGLFEYDFKRRLKSQYISMRLL
jgi:hypothetical protein